ncbi:MAG: glycosyltransferase family 2 protein [Oscillospiraceae bacterium]
MDCKVSVIVPVYNAQKYLQKAFDSVRRQSLGFEKIQLIFCDDCSADNSGQMIEAWAKKYPNVLALRTNETSGSASVPRNVCIRAATAPYIMFLDNDDMLDPRACEELLFAIEKYGADVAGGSYSELHGKRIVDCAEKYAQVPEGGIDLSRSIAPFFSAADPFWTKIFKKSIIDSNKLEFKQVYGEDSLFILSYLACCKKAARIKRTVYIYRIREDSIFHDFSKKHLCEVTQCYKQAFDVLEPKGQLEYYHSFLSLGLSGFMDLLADAQNMTEDDACEVLREWWPLLQYGAQNSLCVESAVSEILVLDAASDEPEKAELHLKALRGLYALRRAQMNEILNSRSWRAISAINRILKR